MHDQQKKKKKKKEERRRSEMQKNAKIMYVFPKHQFSLAHVNWRTQNTETTTTTTNNKMTKLVEGNRNIKHVPTHEN